MHCHLLGQSQPRSFDSATAPSYDTSGSGVPQANAMIRLFTPDQNHVCRLYAKVIASISQRLELPYGYGASALEPAGSRSK
jgi:hypothetical protein